MVILLYKSRWQNMSLSGVKKYAIAKIKDGQTELANMFNDIRTMNKIFSKLLDKPEFKKNFQIITQILEMIVNHEQSLLQIQAHIKLLINPLLKLIKTPDPPEWTLSWNKGQNRDRESIRLERLQRGEMKNKILTQTDELFRSFDNANFQIKTINDKIRTIILNCSICEIEFKSPFFNNIFYIYPNERMFLRTEKVTSFCKKCMPLQIHYKFQWQALSQVNRYQYTYMSNITLPEFQIINNGEFILIQFILYLAKYPIDTCETIKIKNKPTVKIPQIQSFDDWCKIRNSKNL
jgi:hypothetical protein